ncbi:MAG: diguanylate cyclase [Proteobacteria bacterium]|nr:diguanylate cyclase [Pseudomonadota bacterium]
MFSGISLRYVATILGLNALAMGLLFGGLETKVKDLALHKAEVDLAAVGKSYGNQVALKVRTKMQKDGLYGTPDRRLVAAIAEEQAGEVPFKVTVFTSPANGAPVFSNLSDMQAENVSGMASTLESRTDPFIYNMLGNSYVSVVVPILPIEDAGIRRPDYNALIQREESGALVTYTAVRQLLIMVAGGSLLASAALAIFLARGVTAPIARIRKAVEIVEKGEKPAPIPVTGGGEIAKLIKAVNTLIQGPSAKDEVHQQAHTDPLTGLANRRALVSALDDVMKRGYRGKKEVSLMFLDLDGFKPINDTYGHEVGDEVLKTVAKRLGACVRDDDVICRLGGDEFVLMFPGLVDRDSIKQRADLVLEQINEPYWVGDSRVTMGVSIGIAIAPQDGSDGESILNSSDEAMYVAKKQGKNQYAFYS